MIEALDFVESARTLGFHWYAGVPCSFLTPFINYVISDERLHYVSSANEGDALATAAGAAIGGQRAIVMMQNSGLGNAVSPLTSLAWVFRIPLLLICTHRGAPGVSDEPQHELMGTITGELLDLMQVPWEPFPQESELIPHVLGRAEAYLRGERRPYALVMAKDTVAPYALRPRDLAAQPSVTAVPIGEFWDPGAARVARQEALEHILRYTSDAQTVVVATTGYTGRELYALADRSNHLYMVGSMGCASSLGLGLALARPDLHVVIVDGDGAALMRMGNLSTIGAYGQSNLTHIILDNEAHDSTGAQATVSARVSFARVAHACGYALALEGDDPALIDALLTRTPRRGPALGHLKIRTGTLEKLPRPRISPVEVLDRLMARIGSTL